MISLSNVDEFSSHLNLISEYIALTMRYICILNILVEKDETITLDIGNRTATLDNNNNNNNKSYLNPQAHEWHPHTHTAAITVAWMESSIQAFRLPGLHGSSRGVCWSQWCKAHASRWFLAELAPWLALPADVDVREPWVVLVELMDLAGGLSVSLDFWVVTAGLGAWGICVSMARCERCR